MKNLTKVLFTFTLIISFFIILYVCNNLNKHEYSIKDNYSKKKLDKVITESIIKYNSTKLIGDIFFETHKLYGIENKEDKLYIYITSCIEGFVFDNDKLRTGSSSCCPVRLILNANDYSLVDYKVPTDGMNSNEALKKLFPKKYYKMALNYNSEFDKLLAKNKNKLLEWLKQHNKNEDSLILP